MNSKPVHTFNFFVNKTNFHDFFEKIKNFKKKFVDSKNCSLIQEYFMSRI